MKKYFNYFVYISILFLIISLIKLDYLKAPQVQSVSLFLLSIITLFGGFALEALSWQRTLKIYGFKIPFSISLTSIGLSVFGKYVPGKIWVIMGRSAYISNQFNYSERETAYLSFITQIISLWVGFLFGIIGLFFVNPLSGIIVYSAVGLWVVLTLILFIKPIQNFFLRVLSFILKKKLKIPLLKIKSVIKILPYFIARWITFSLSFYLFAQSLSQASLGLEVGLAYPLAGTLAMAAFIIPGGIGIREAIIAGILITSGLSDQVATTISVSSRLWYLSGEFFIFFIGFLLSRLKS